MRKEKTPEEYDKMRDDVEILLQELREMKEGPRKIHIPQTEVEKEINPL